MNFPPLRYLSLASLWLVCSGPTVATEQSPLLPLEHFFAEPDIRSPQVAPDGRHLVFLTTLGTGKVGLALMRLADGKIEPLVAAKDENIDSFFWKTNDLLVYGGDIGGNESPALRAFSLSKRRVVPLAESYRAKVANLANWASVIDRLPFLPHHLLVLGPKSIGSMSIDLWMLDVRDGKRRGIPLATSTDDVLTYIADNAGVVRARLRLLGDRSLVEVRRTATSAWEQVATFPANDPQWSLLHFSADNETLYLLSTTNTDTASLHALDTRTLQLGPPLFQPPAGEIERLIASYDRTRLEGLIYNDDKPRYHWFAADRARLQAQIDASLPDTFNVVTSRSADEQILVVLATSDRHPGTYYLLDRRAPRLMLLGQTNRHLQPAQLRPMTPIRFTARDGLSIHGYLTLPWAAAGERVPLIVHPHGGPFGIRDEWGFNPDVQFLANRGYAVLQINYRGSGGYGTKFLKAGQREWGGKMQDDLTDGVHWAIDRGIADPRRIAIYGASYGGYAALAGATSTPDLYCCAVNYVGVSDLSLITSWGRGRIGRSSDMFAREWVGDDRGYKFDRSPLNFVDRIRIPTLHAYGFNDPRVEIDHWRRLEPKLKQFNKPYEILIEDDEGHGFANEKTRLQFYQHLERFLARHLLPSDRTAPDASP